MKKRLTIIVGALAALAGSSWSDPAVRSFPTAAPRAAAPANVPAHELEEALIAKASSLSSGEQLAFYLGDSGTTGGASLSTRARVKRLLDDPALAVNFDSIREDWFRGALTDWTGGPRLFGSVRELVECKIMIARNLYFRGLAPTAERVREEYERIQRLRLRYGEMEIFAGRNVVFAASDDRARGGEPMFGRPPTVRWLDRKAESMVFLKKGEGAERPAETGARLAENLSTFANLTFVFEGHGRQNEMKFAGSLTPETVVDNLVERPSRETSLYVSPPWSVLVINACQAHTFSRNLFDLYRKAHPDRQLPLVIVPVEFGDELVKSVYNDGFFKRELRLSYNTDTHLGALFGVMKAATSVYVPDEDNVLTQIA